MKHFILRNFALLLPALLVAMVLSGFYVGYAHGLEAAVAFAQLMNTIFWFATFVWLIALAVLIGKANKRGPK